MLTHNVFSIENLSGWLLPEGRFVPTEDWWHVNGLYDLKDNCYPLFQTQKALEIFKAGEEEPIRNLASELGLLKIARGQIDGEKINLQQLNTLKKLLELLDPELEFEILTPQIGLLKKVSVFRLLKIKNPEVLFGS